MALGTRRSEWARDLLLPSKAVLRDAGAGGLARGIEWQVPADDIKMSLPPHMDIGTRLPKVVSDVRSDWCFGRMHDPQRDMPMTPCIVRVEIGRALSIARNGPPRTSRQRGRQSALGVAPHGRQLDCCLQSDGAHTSVQHTVFRTKLPALDGTAAAPDLRVRPERVLRFHNVAPTEVEDLKRLRGYEISSAGRTYKIYRGDTHRHTEFSMDGNNDGSLFQTYRYALDAASLDYLLVSEHNFQGGPDNPYINWVLQQAADLFSVSGTFQPFYGYERSVRYPDGHRNILLPKRGIRPCRSFRRSQHASGEVGVRVLARQWRHRYFAHLGDRHGHRLARQRSGGRTLGGDIPRRPCVGRIRRCPPSGGRQSADYAGGGFDRLICLEGLAKGTSWRASRSTLVTQYSSPAPRDRLSRQVIDAMKQRHSYGATDNIVLDYRMEANGGEYLQGDIVKVDGDFRLTVNILGTSPIRQIDIIKNQEFLYTRQKLPQDVEFSYEDAGKTPGEDYYYVRVVQNDGNVAWSLRLGDHRLSRSGPGCMRGACGAWLPVRTSGEADQLWLRTGPAEEKYAHGQPSTNRQGTVIADSPPGRGRRAVRECGPVPKR